MDDITIELGNMLEAGSNTRFKHLYLELQKIEDNWRIVRPSPAFKILKRTNGQVYLKMNTVMLKMLLMRLAELPTMSLQNVEPETAPAWFMALLGNEPYEHLLPPEGAVIPPKGN